MSVTRISGCTVAECDGTHYARRLCYVHWKRWRRYGTTDQQRRRGSCTLDDCTRPHCALGLCRLHWSRLRRTGSVELRPAQQGCDAELCTTRHYARGYCRNHYESWRRHGYVKPVTHRMPPPRRGRVIPEDELMRLRRAVGLLEEAS